MLAPQKKGLVLLSRVVGVPRNCDGMVPGERKGGEMLGRGVISNPKVLPWSGPGADRNGKLREEEEWRHPGGEDVLDEIVLHRKEKEALAQRISELEKELYQYQYHMGLLLIDKKEFAAKYEKLRQEISEVVLSRKNMQTTHIATISEFEKREGNLRKAMEFQRQSIVNLEKVLNETHAETAELKLEYQKKLSEAQALEATVEEKYLEIRGKLHSFDVILADVSRKSSDADRRLEDVEAREEKLSRQSSSFSAEKLAFEKDLAQQRENLRAWEQELQDNQKRLAEWNRFLNEREKESHEREKNSKKNEKELGKLQGSIRLEEDQNICMRLRILGAQGKEVLQNQEIVEKKEKELLATEEKLSNEGGNQEHGKEAMQEQESDYSKCNITTNNFISLSNQDESETLIMKEHKDQLKWGKEEVLGNRNNFVQTTPGVIIHKIRDQVEEPSKESDYFTASAQHLMAYWRSKDGGDTILPQHPDESDVGTPSSVQLEARISCMQKCPRLLEISPEKTTAENIDKSVCTDAEPSLQEDNLEPGLLHGNIHAFQWSQYGSKDGGDTILPQHPDESDLGTPSSVQLEARISCMQKCPRLLEISPEKTTAENIDKSVCTDAEPSLQEDNLEPGLLHGNIHAFQWSQYGSGIQYNARPERSNVDATEHSLDVPDCSADFMKLNDSLRDMEEVTFPDPNGLGKDIGSPLLDLDSMSHPLKLKQCNHTVRRKPIYVKKSRSVNALIKDENLAISQSKYNELSNCEARKFNPKFPKVGYYYYGDQVALNSGKRRLPLRYGMNTKREGEHAGTHSKNPSSVGYNTEMENSSRTAIQGLKHYNFRRSTIMRAVTASEPLASRSKRKRIGLQKLLAKGKLLKVVENNGEGAQGHPCANENLG